LADDALFSLVVVILLAVAFDYINGFHDTANAIATSVATRALRPLHAILMATAFNFIGAFAGTAVAKTIGAGLVDEATTTQAVVAAALIGAITWNLITWYLALPSSSSHALIGGLLGATIVAAGFGALKLDGIFNKVLVPMISSPIIGFTGAFLLMLAIYWIFRNAKRKPMARRFRRLQVISAGYMAFSHGSNDAQKTMGIITLALFAAGAIPTIDVPFWVIVVSATAISLGTVSAAGGSCTRWATASLSSSRSRVRRGDDRRDRHHRCREPGHARIDDARDLERHHGRRLRPRAEGRPLGCRPSHPPRLDHHDPRSRDRRRRFMVHPACHRLRLSKESFDVVPPASEGRPLLRSLRGRW
jgi:PiT family inorganic phosphate transporter